MNSQVIAAGIPKVTVAILGGYGDLGRVAARLLLESDHITLRIGGRSLEQAQQCCAQLGSRTEPWQVDFRDEIAMSAFLDKVDVLLNCAGPSWQLKDRAANAALQAKAHYVDVAGDELLYDLMQRNQPDYHGCSLVLSAGLQPGLSALFPTWVAQQAFSSVRTLCCYSGIRDQFTHIAADDFLQGAVNGHSEPLAAWRQGVCTNALTRKDHVQLPFFPGIGLLLPALSHENQRFARQFGLQTGSWYACITGQHIRRVFERVMSQSREEAAHAMRQASLLDLAGSEPWVINLLQMSGLDLDGREVTKTVLLRGKGNAALSGAIAASAVMEVLADKVAEGCHYAAQALDAQCVMDNLQLTGVISAISWFEGTIDELMHEEEGVL